jgi:hypothetical protein
MIREEAIEIMLSNEFREIITMDQHHDMLVRKE